MPFIWGILATFVPWAFSGIVRSLGLGFVTYYGIGYALTHVEQYIFNNFEGIGGAVFQIIVLAGIPDGIKILFAAFAVAISLKFASSGGRVSKQVWKRPGPFEA